MSPRHAQPLRGLPRESEKAGGERSEPFGKARRFIGAAQPAHRRSGRREYQHGDRAASASKVAYPSFRPAQQPEHDGAHWSRTQGKALGDGCECEQDDGKTPERLVIFPVHRLPVHRHSRPCSCGNDSIRHVSMSRIIFRPQEQKYSVSPWTALTPNLGSDAVDFFLAAADILARYSVMIRIGTPVAVAPQFDGLLAGRHLLAGGPDFDGLLHWHAAHQPGVGCRCRRGRWMRAAQYDHQQRAHSFPDPSTPQNC